MPNIEEFLTDQALQDYTQSREYPLTVGDGLFPTDRTEEFEIKYLLGSNAAPVSASVHAYDTESQIGSRDGIEEMSMEPALIKRKIKMGERLIKSMTQARTNAEVQRVIDRIYNDVDNMVNSVRTRIERMRFEAISTGKLTINENGLKGTINYGVAKDQKETLTDTKIWSDAKAKPLDDIDRFVNKVVEHSGVTPTRILTSRKVFNVLKRHDSVRKGIFGVNSARLVTNAELNAFLQEQGLPAIATDDRVYREQKNDGSYVTKRFFPEDAFVLLPGGELGKTVHGITPEEANMRYMQTATFENFGNIVAQIYSTNDPVARWTKAVALAMPSFPTANQIFIANVLGGDGNDTP
ncbi:MULTISPECIES: major capsid protein [Clostridia]|uniref:major capsid protein n=1 Tax=Clostridia TaxID=186801 RepID=UPI000EA0D1C0|nr:MULTISPECIES: major capsid protein [Clostridia]NBJ71338.1 capsid protein [Roseburia sp. 1XD42-34]RKI74405.1 capsid protein [Clostridium sp. 1xD42-85]